MDENEAIEEQATATPIFSVYRRGYDPDQVDRYVGEQQRRLDDASHRASESERKLAAAVGQLRELHRRVAVYESEARNQQPAQLDTLGERVQRILQEAWEGAYNLRQEAEREVNEMREHAAREVEDQRVQAHKDVEELREVASREAADVVDEATRRALYIREETERRRQAYLERVELDRERAIAQITYLYDQRQGAIAELARLQATVEATIAEMVRSPLGRPAPGLGGVGTRSAEPERPLVITGVIDESDEDPREDPEPSMAAAAPVDDDTLVAVSLSDLEGASDFSSHSSGPSGQAGAGGSGGSGEASERLFDRDAKYAGYGAEADVPTGPMEQIDATSYGRYEDPYPSANDDASDSHPRRSGLFDGEQEGWA